jgi:hypothetical protein
MPTSHSETWGEKWAVDYLMKRRKMSGIIYRRGEATSMGPVLVTVLQAENVITNVHVIFRVPDAN